MAAFGNAHRVGPYPAAFWRGDAPRFAYQRISTHTRPGANGVGRLLLGKSGQRFTAELEFHSAVYARGLQLYAALMNLTGRPPVPLVYNRQALYRAPWRHLFHVEDVDLVRADEQVRIMGPNYDFVAGAAIVCAVTFRPFPLF